MPAAKCWMGLRRAGWIRLPIKVTPAGEITIIDMEFKAGTKAQVRIV